MTPNSDWHDMLAALRGDEPPTPEPSEPHPEASRAAQKATLDIILDRKRRGGKLSTIIAGFDIPDADVDSIAADLRRTLATGGSSRGGEILLQGDCRPAALKALQRLGLKARII